jgi:transcriptional regulator with XRE-family HTH domain
MKLDLASVRNEIGKTQNDLAISTVRANISHIERAANPYLSTLKDYAKTLGAEVKLSLVRKDLSIVLLKLPLVENRKDFNIGQIEFAKKRNVHQTAVSKIENKIGDVIRLSTIKNYTNTLDCDLVVDFVFPDKTIRCNENQNVTLATIRKSRKFTLKQLAVRSGTMSSDALSHIEQRANNKISSLENYAKALEAKITYIFSWDDNVVEQNKLAFNVIRKMKKMKQADLEKRMKLRKTVVSAIEARSDWEVATVKKYAKGLDVKFNIRFDFPNGERICLS